MPTGPKQAPLERADSDLAKRISLAWLNYAQDPSATQHEKLQQLRANIARDLALESTVARRQRQVVSPPTVVEPRRVFAASRLDVGRLKERFEKLETSNSKSKPWASSPQDRSSPIDGLPGLAALEISKAKRFRPDSASHCSDYVRKRIGNTGDQAPDVHPLASTPTGPEVTKIEEVQQAGMSAMSEPFVSQCSKTVAKAIAGAATDPLSVARSYRGPCKRAIRKAADTAAANAKLIRQPLGMAPTPEVPACMHSTKYNFITGELESGAHPSGKRGNLQFTSSFEGGNIGKVLVRKAKHDYTIYVRPDTENDRYRLWFHFKVRNAKDGQQVHLAIINFSKTRSLFRIGMTPVYRSSTLFPKWQRLPPDCCFYYTQDSPSSDYALSMAVQFHGGPSEVYEFAFSFPYTYTYLQHTLHWVETMCEQRTSRDCNYIKRKLLCRTPQMRRVDMLVISEPMVQLPQAWTNDEYTAQVQRNECGLQASYVDLLQSYSNTGQRMIHPLQDGVRNVVFITGRVHPGETPASHVVHGMIAFLTSQDTRAKMLRKLVTWVIVPMLNPDGVAAGNYRCDAGAGAKVGTSNDKQQVEALCLGGLDLNRLWRMPSRDLEPSVFYTLKSLMEFDGDKRFSLDAYIDVHSHSNSRAGFLYMNPLPASHSGCAPLLEFLYRLPKVMASLVPGFQYNKCCCSMEAAKASCGRRAAGMHLPNTLCYTFEISFFNAMEDIPASSNKSARASAQSTSLVRSYSDLAQQQSTAGQLAWIIAPCQCHPSIQNTLCRVFLPWIMQTPYPDIMTWARILLAPS